MRRQGNSGFLLIILLMFLIMRPSHQERERHNRYNHSVDTTFVVEKDSSLFNSVIKAMNDNQVQAARNLVATTDEKNALYDMIRDNDIQSARDYIKYKLSK